MQDCFQTEVDTARDELQVGTSGGVHDGDGDGEGLADLVKICDQIWVDGERESDVVA